MDDPCAARATERYSTMMRPPIDSRITHLARLGVDLERRGLPAWVIGGHDTPLLRVIRLKPRKTMLVACVRLPNGRWVFVWSKGWTWVDNPSAAAWIDEAIR